LKECNPTKTKRTDQWGGAGQSGKYGVGPLKGKGLGKRRKGVTLWRELVTTWDWSLGKKRNTEQTDSGLAFVGGEVGGG